MKNHFIHSCDNLYKTSSITLTLLVFPKGDVEILPVALGIREILALFPGSLDPIVAFHLAFGYVVELAAYQSLAYGCDAVCIDGAEQMVVFMLHNAAQETCEFFFRVPENLRRASSGAHARHG